MKMLKLEWNNKTNLQSVSYTCGYCGTPIASDKGWVGSTRGFQDRPVFVMICHQCTRPTFIDSDRTQTPGKAFGAIVENVDDPSVHAIYEEARRATSAGSYTAAVLCCRKLLMHIAVAKGAGAGENFLFYVDYLKSKNFFPPDANQWVDHVRKRGNEANHEINVMKQEDAEELIDFCSMLLKIIYEFPAVSKRRYGTARAAPAKMASS